MTLFSDDPTVPGIVDRDAVITAPAVRRRRRGWIALAVGFVLLGVLAIWPSSYVIQQPGPVFDTLGSVESDDEDVPLITIDGTETYPTSGSLDMLTVQVLGNPEQRPGWFEIVSAWFDPARMVVPLEAVFPSDQTLDERNEQNEELMVDSQQDAIAAALSELGYEFPAEFSIGRITEGSPAEGTLKVDDVLVSVNDVPVPDVETIREVLIENGTEKPAEFDVIRGGVPTTVSVTPEPWPLENGETMPVVGITTTYVYDFPVDVTIQLDDVGGPSAGMMFALGIVDKLTPGELNAGEQVAGTGTIGADGAVGPIGGVRQKLYGAQNAGAGVFLAPQGNCQEVVGHVPDGLDVYSVATLDDAIAVLETISSGDGADELPTCESVASED
ncbi:PDZ domain-containing protein [Okibacterium endophyticum]